MGYLQSRIQLPSPCEFGGDTNIQSVATPYFCEQFFRNKAMPIHLSVVYRLPSCYNTKDEYRQPRAHGL